MTERKRVFRGERLRRIREQREFTQDELAALLGLGQSQLNKYENNKSDPTPEVMVRLATELNVTTDWLLGLVDEVDERISDNVELTPQERKLISALRRRDYESVMRTVVEQPK